MIEDIAEQLQKSRQFTMYSIGGLCVALLAAVLFYVLMAAQLSSKVGEIDSMLGAMAKRTLQMTRGIETFSAIEMRLDEGLANQLLQREMLAANEIAMVELNEMLDGLPGEVTGATANALTQTQQALASELQQLQEENKTLGQELNRLQKALDAQAAEVSALRGVRRELSTLRSSMQQVESTVGDLYIIERARVAKQVLSVKEELPIQ
jgi:ABC-type transporter Mla subunit MlaD